MILRASLLSANGSGCAEKGFITRTSRTYTGNVDAAPAAARCSTHQLHIAVLSWMMRYYRSHDYKHTSFQASHATADDNVGDVENGERDVLSTWGDDS